METSHTAIQPVPTIGDHKSDSIAAEVKQPKRVNMARQYQKEMTIGELRESYKKTKKYCILTPSRKLVHFGNRWKQHFCDTTPLGLFRSLDNKSGVKKDKFYSKHKDEIDNPESAYHYEAKYLY